MSAMDELKAAVAEVAADALAANDEVMVAIDHIAVAVDLDPDIMPLVESLKQSHAAFTDTIGKLKDKVDSVLVSGGNA